MINAKRYNDAQEFNDLVKDFLERNEVINVLSLGVLGECINNAHKNEDIFIAIQDNDNVVFTMIQTKSNMILTGEIDYIDEAVNFILENKINIKSIIGKADLVKSFAKSFTNKSNMKSVVKMNQRIYRIDKVNNIKFQDGDLMLAKHSDINILSTWIKNFMIECGGDIIIEEAKQKLKGLIVNKKLYVYKHKEIVSMVGKTKPTRNGIVINYVYTPKEYRNKGYATTCVAKITQKLLTDYKFCSLYTDLSNPTSNSIYKKIGYKPVADSLVVEFIK